MVEAFGDDISLETGCYVLWIECVEYEMRWGYGERQCNADGRM